MEWRRIAREWAVDAAIGLLWAVLLVVVLFFSSGASDFIYVDF